MVKQHSRKVRTGINLRYVYKIHAHYNIIVTHPTKMSPCYMLIHDKHWGVPAKFIFYWALNALVSIPFEKSGKIIVINKRKQAPKKGCFLFS